MSEWRWTTIGELTINFDSLRRPVKSSDRRSGSIPYYGASGIIDWVDGYTHDGRYLLIAEDGENLRSRSTPIAFMSTGKSWVNNHAHVVTGTHESDTRFLEYLFAVTDVLGYLTGSAQPKLSRSSLDSIAVRVPELSEQQAIAEVLGALDDKIAANAKLISTADELSQSIFLSMNRTDGPLIPLSTTARFVNGKAFTKNASGTGRVVIRIAELNSGIGGSTVYNDINVDDQHVASPGDLLFAWSGSLTLHRWYRPAGIVNQHIFKVIPNNGYPHWLIYGLLRHKLDEFKSIAADKATTMGHIQRKHLDELVAVPALEEIHKYDELMTGLWELALAAEVENCKAVAMRDALLPQLVSGSLRVKDAEKVLVDAAV